MLTGGTPWLEKRLYAKIPSAVDICVAEPGTVRLRFSLSFLGCRAAWVLSVGLTCLVAWC